jgi:hypothetical protein
MRMKGRITAKQLVAMLQRSDFDLRLAEDAAASLEMGAYLLERIAGARRETVRALRAVEAVEAQRKE